MNQVVHQHAPRVPIGHRLLLTIEGAAALLSMSRTAFKSHLAAGRIGPRAIRFGRSVRFSRDELATWAGAGCPPRERWVDIRSAQRPVEDPP